MEQEVTLHKAKQIAELIRQAAIYSGGDPYKNGELQGTIIGYFNLVADTNSKKDQEEVEELFVDMLRGLVQQFGKRSKS